MGRKRKPKASVDEQPNVKKRKLEQKEVKEAKEEPLEENEDERIEEEKPLKKTYKKYIPKGRPIDGDPKSKLLCKRHPSLFLELKDANPEITLEELEKITCGSNRIFNWKCLNHKSCDKHVWKAIVSNRIYNGIGCPYCFGKGKHKKECLCSLPSFLNIDGTRKPGKEHIKRCPKCMKEKTKDRFTFNTNKKNGFNSWCRECTSEFDAVSSAMMRIYLKGKCCQDCGTTNDVVLEFDHINNDKSKTKKGKPKGMMSLSPHKLCGELKKTDIVCVSCHRIRTFSRHLRKSTASKKTLKKRELAQKLKLERNCCSHCTIQITEETTNLFDCDHVDPATKIAGVGTMVIENKYTLKHVENEIAKCQLLCCNCHRTKTAKDRNWRIISDFSDEVIAKARAFLDQHFMKDPSGNYIHIRPVKVEVVQINEKPKKSREVQSNDNLMSLLAALSDQKSDSKKVQSFEN